MAEQFIPNLEGDIVARQLYKSSEPDRAADHLNAFGRSLGMHYTRIGMAAHDPERAYRLKVVGVWRAASAPIIYGIERELQDIVRWRQEQKLPLAAPDIPEHINTERIYKQFSNYDGSQLAFLQAT